jgi:hypothetical protein
MIDLSEFEEIMEAMGTLCGEKKIQVLRDMLLRDDTFF